LFYGLIGAFILRFGSLFIISFLVDVWQIQAIGALYLIFLSIKHLYDKATLNEQDVKKKESKSRFWMTVLKVEIADLAFTVDSILAAVALAVTLPATGLFELGCLDGAKYIVLFTSVMIGVIIRRLA